MYVRSQSVSLLFILYILIFTISYSTYWFLLFQNPKTTSNVIQRDPFTAFSTDLLRSLDENINQLSLYDAAAAAKLSHYDNAMNLQKVNNLRPESASFSPTSNLHPNNGLKIYHDTSRSSPESLDSLEFLRELSEESSVRSHQTYDRFSSGSHSDYSGSLSPESIEFDFSLSAAYQYQQMQQRRMRKPPEGYLCHLCFCKGHYIKDCPEVRFCY